MLAHGKFVIVDRILRKQKAERQAVEDAAREREKQMLLVSNSNSNPVESLPGPPVPNKSTRPDQPSQGNGSPLVPELVSDRSGARQSSSMIRSSIDNWRRKLTG